MDKKEEIRLCLGDTFGNYFCKEIPNNAESLLKMFASEIQSIDENNWKELNQAKNETGELTDKIKGDFEDLEKVFLKVGYSDFKTFTGEVKTEILKKLNGFAIRLKELSEATYVLGNKNKKEINLEDIIREYRKRIKELSDKFEIGKARILAKLESQ